VYEMSTWCVDTQCCIGYALYVNAYTGCKPCSDNALWPPYYVSTCTQKIACTMEGCLHYGDECVDIPMQHLHDTNKCVTYISR
jgi:hypothetical protein